MITIKENVGFEGWPNCVHLSNRKIELIVTTDIGPRIIRLGYVEGSNMLYVSAADRGKVGGDQWRIYGGHRLTTGHPPTLQWRVARFGANSHQEQECNEPGNQQDFEPRDRPPSNSNHGNAQHGK